MTAPSSKRERERKSRERFQEGAWVRLKWGKRSSQVVTVLAGGYGGRVLDKPLGGFRYWNIQDLARGERVR